MAAAIARVDPTRPEDGADAWETPHGFARILAPTPKGRYYRISAGKGINRKQTTAPTFELAWRKALNWETEILDGATPASERLLDEGIDYWLQPGRPTPRGGWGTSQAKNMTAYATNYFRPALGAVRGVDLRRGHFQEIVNKAPTKSEGMNLRRASSSLLFALHQGDFLPEGRSIDLSSVWWHDPVAFASGQLARSVSEDDAETADERGGFVPVHKRPSDDQVAALRDAAASFGRGPNLWVRGLMVELAAYAGPRWSELMAIEAPDVHARSRKLNIFRRVEFVTGMPPCVVAPKMAKRRVTIFPEVSPTGYELEEMLRRRAEQALAEQRAGINPRALLFPSAAGTWRMTGNFHRDIFEKAADRAGWPSVTSERPYAGRTRTERTWGLTWHSLRHTFCTVALEVWKLADSTVAELAGHDDSSTTRRLYVGASRDSINEALAATSRLRAVEQAEDAVRQAEERLYALRNDLRAV